MSQIFSESGQSENVGVSPPSLLGNYINSIDNPYAGDGFGIVYPWGSSNSLRKYEGYGTTGSQSNSSTLLNDLTSGLLGGGGGGLSVNLEGLVGPQGPPGPAGLPGTSLPITNWPQVPGLFSLLGFVIIKVADEAARLAVEYETGKVVYQEDNGILYLATDY